MNRLELTDDAAGDLGEIWSFISRDSVESADRWIQLLYNKCRMIADWPFVGKARPELGKDARTYAVGNYVIIYRAEPDGIVVLRILNGFRDIEQMMADKKR